MRTKLAGSATLCHVAATDIDSEFLCHINEMICAQNKPTNYSPATMYKYEETVISPTGLRYTSKANGSLFQGVGGTGETLSCIKCGNHKLKKNGTFKRYLNAPIFFCFDCKPKKIDVVN